MDCKSWILTLTPNPGYLIKIPKPSKMAGRHYESNIRPHVVFSGKGFGGKATETSQAAEKLSKRGTRVSRPGPLGKKQLRLQSEEMQEVYAAEEEEEEEQPIQEVPTVVNNRMLTRIIIFSGAPVFLAFCLFPVFYYLKTVKGVDIPYELVFFVQSLVFGGGLLGITYGVVSASWSPTREGSFLGIEEFKENFGLLKDRVMK